MAKAQEVFQNRIIGYATKPADQFQANALNYRKHPQRQRDAVNGSLRELGWIAAVIENVRTGNLVDGHERVWQALRNNEDVPYLQVDLSEEEERLALAIFDPITNMAETDAVILNELLQDVNTGEAALQELLATLAESITVPDGDEWAAGFGNLPTEDKAPFQQMTFTLHDTQAEQVTEAIRIAKAAGAFVDSPNENSNGNALARICETYITDYGQS